MTAFCLARNVLRSTLWQSLQNQSHPSVFNSSKLLIQKAMYQRLMPSAYLRTSHNLYSASAHDHSHSKIWTMERVLSASMLAVLPAAVAFPSPILDYAVALTLTAHVHWGIEAIVVDYIRPSVVGATLSKVAVAVVYGLSAFTLGGLFYFNYSDVGIGNAVRLLWKL